MLLPVHFDDAPDGAGGALNTTNLSVGVRPTVASRDVPWHAVGPEQGVGSGRVEGLIVTITTTHVVHNEVPTIPLHGCEVSNEEEDGEMEPPHTSI